MSLNTATSDALASAAVRKEPQPSRITVLVNADAGGARGHEITGQVRDAFTEAGASVDIELRSGSQLERRANALAKPATILVAAGGDGTVSTVASAVVANGGTLGILPLGTLNHFAKDLGVPLRLADAARVILTGRVVKVDVGDVNGRTFVNNSSLGLYPHVVMERERERRRGHRKWIAFAIAVGRTWRRYRRLVVHITRDGVETVIDTPFVFVGNNEYQVSGFGLGGRSTLTNGTLSLYAARACARLDVLRLLVRTLVERPARGKQLEAWTLHGARIETSLHRMNVAVDGELVRMATPLRYEIRPGALPVLVPEER
jgi:diacylglycerol kinase family enzyme